MMIFGFSPVLFFCFLSHQVIGRIQIVRSFGAACGLNEHSADGGSFFIFFTAPIAEPLFEVSEHANGERRSGLVPAETFWSPPLYRALALGAPPAGALRKQAHEKTGT